MIKLQSKIAKAGQEHVTEAENMKSKTNPKNYQMIGSRFNSVITVRHHFITF